VQNFIQNWQILFTSTMDVKTSTADPALWIWSA